MCRWSELSQLQVIQEKNSVCYKGQSLLFPALELTQVHLIYQVALFWPRSLKHTLGTGTDIMV